MAIATVHAATILTIAAEVIEAIYCRSDFRLTGRCVISNICKFVLLFFQSMIKKYIDGGTALTAGHTAGNKVQRHQQLSSIVTYAQDD